MTPVTTREWVPSTTRFYIVKDDHTNECTFLAHDFLHHISFDVGQAEIAARMAEGELLVV